MDSFQIKVTARAFKLEPKPLQGRYASLLYIAASQEHTYEITKGYVYTFIRPLRRNTPMSYEKYPMNRVGIPIILPHRTDGISNKVYCAYSQIELSEERVTDIMQDIEREPHPYRAVKIDTSMLLPESHEYLALEYAGTDSPLYYNRDKNEIYLYDWFDYLEQCATSYYGAVSPKVVDGNYTVFNKYLSEEVSATGGKPEGSGITRGEAYLLADSIEAIIVDHDKGRIGGSLRTALRPDGHAGQTQSMSQFLNEVLNQLEVARSEDNQADIMNKTIRLISFLMRDRQANSTFLDYSRLIQEIGTEK
ncbi:MAG: hypothetical protein FWE20_11995 [Defluviitaleaceae bacterium]|nr:hypothetical protein [Defluviitaleaceae bacterium]